MRRFKFGSAAIALLALCAPAAAETTVLNNVTVIDGTGAAAAPASTADSAYREHCGGCRHQTAPDQIRPFHE